jgi:hypothetical protein
MSLPTFIGPGGPEAMAPRQAPQLLDRGRSSALARSAASARRRSLPATAVAVSPKVLHSSPHPPVGNRVTQSVAATIGRPRERFGFGVFFLQEGSRKKLVHRQQGPERAARVAALAAQSERARAFLSLTLASPPSTVRLPMQTGRLGDSAACLLGALVARALRKPLVRTHVNRERRVPPNAQMDGSPIAPSAAGRFHFGQSKKTAALPATAKVARCRRQLACGSLAL